MMNPEEQFKALAARARAETAPQMDVTHGVIRTLRSMQAESVMVSEKPLMWVAALSSAAAVPAAVFAFIAYYGAGDPLIEITQTISWVMQ